MTEFPYEGGEQYSDLPWYYRLDPARAEFVGTSLVRDAGVRMLGEVAAAGEDGLVLPSGMGSEALHAGLLELWGQLERGTNDTGDATYHLPEAARLAIANNQHNPELARVNNELAKKGYCLTSFAWMGLSGPSFDLREHLQRSYFDAGLLEEVPGDRPEGRWRARGVLFFGPANEAERFVVEGAEWSYWGGQFVGRYPSLNVPQREKDNISDRGIPPDILPVNDDALIGYSMFLTGLSDYGNRMSTVGMNMFGIGEGRGTGNVVDKIHQDDLARGSIAVVDLDAGAAVTLLYLDEDGEHGELIFRQQLQAGEVLIHNDRFPAEGPPLFHHTSTLLPLWPGHAPKRNALITSLEPWRRRKWTLNLSGLLRPV